MTTVHVAAGKPYDVLIERGLLMRSGEVLKAALGGRACAAAILTDDTVDALYGGVVEASLSRSGFRACRFMIPHGEAHKNIATWAQMLDFLAAEHITRTDVIVALGGGVVGDMAGFAAASYLRGVAFMQIPTTLLAMVDSSVGGKTGVNLPAGKNQVGAFYQPLVVLADPDTLQTLPPDTLADGVAESIKYGVLGDEALFELLGGGNWQSQMEHVIATCVAAKAKLVEEDERDTGSRQLLNLGHTLGHGIEKCSHFSISHGHAVAVGMVYAARLAQRLGLCGADVRERIEAALIANNLPVSAPYGAQALCGAALSDKKRAGGQIVFVLPRAIGACELRRMDVADLPRLIRLAVEE
ncbi:MAG: 3-dehydroquinate synthase [Eubacteriales bacterium]|nr:3-dehydroquinate synthase [Eubacteriales bacterium]